MDRRRLSRSLIISMVIPVLVIPPGTARAGVIESIKQCFNGGEEVPLTMKEVAGLVDHIDHKLFDLGTIAIKSPDVWGQNRMTKYRAEFEGEMQKDLGSFQQILQAAQRRADIASTTSATSLAATISAAKPPTSGLGGARTTTPTTPSVNNSTTIHSTPAGSSSTTPAAGTGTSAASASSGGGAGSSSGDASDPGALLTAVSARIDALEKGVLTLPNDISHLATKKGDPGVGLEPTIGLDEKARYLNHLHQLRRINGGDDLTDMAGYGLYLLRLPVSLIPGEETRKGKGAMVTMEAYHDLKEDLLASTFRDVTILDATYGLTQVINEEIHADLMIQCCGGKPSTGILEPPAPDVPQVLKDAVLNEFRFDIGKRDFGSKEVQLNLEKLANLRNPTSEQTKQAVQAAQSYNAREDVAEFKVFRRDVQPFIQPLPPGHENKPTPPQSNGTGPTSVQSNAWRIILGRYDWPGKDIEPPKTNVKSASKASRDEGLVQARFLAAAPKSSYPDTLKGRWLDLLIISVEQVQKDSYRHDPTTLSLMQGGLIETYRFMRNNAQANDTDGLFTQKWIDRIGESYLKRDFATLIADRDMFLRSLVAYRQNKPFPLDTNHDQDWEKFVTPTDVLAFVLEVQFAAVDRQLKEDMAVMAQRRNANLGPVDHLKFYDFYPTPDASQAFIEYVKTKWPLHVYSVDPVVEQQNVLDAFSRRTELQLALATSVATGQVNIKNATTFARQLDLDLETIGLNRTAVGFGAGESTFGWMFYPRVQTPPTVGNVRRVTNTFLYGGEGQEFDLKNRRMEPGQRECIALIVTPNFIPALRLTTVANWFDITGKSSRRELNNRKMLEYSHMLQVAKNSLAKVCDSREYRASDLTILAKRINQLENLLPTQDTRVDLPDEGDLLGSEIFSSNASGLAPSLLAWYGEPVQEGQQCSVFLQGRGFSVTETQVIAGGVNIPDTQKRLISRNVMEIIIPANARLTAINCSPADDAHKDDHSQQGTGNPAPKPTPAAGAASSAQAHIESSGVKIDASAGDQAHARVGGVQANADGAGKAQADLQIGASQAHSQGAKAQVRIGDVEVVVADPAAATDKTKAPCRTLLDIHIATPNGISNHMFVDAVPKSAEKVAKNAVTTATTTTVVNGNTTTTSTKFETTPPGTVLPALTVLPMGTNWPPATVLAPGAINGAPKGSLMQGLVPTADASPAPASQILNGPASPAATTTTGAADANAAPAAANKAPAPAPAAPAPAAPAPAAPAPAAPAPGAPAPGAPPKPAAANAKPAAGPVVPTDTNLPPLLENAPTSFRTSVPSLKTRALIETMPSERAPVVSRAAKANTITPGLSLKLPPLPPASTSGRAIRDLQTVRTKAAFPADRKTVGNKPAAPPARKSLIKRLTGQDQ